MTAAIEQTSADVTRAFEIIYSSNLDVVQWLLSRHVADRSVVEELAQELFLKVWQEMAAGRLVFQRLGKLVAFFEPRARWEAMAYLRRRSSIERQRQRSLESEEISFDTSHAALRSAVPGADVTVPNRLDIGRALAMLPAAERRAVALRYLEGMTPGEVAETIGASPRVERARTNSALRTLREAYGVPEQSATDRTRKAADDKQAAIEAYRASVAAGAPLTFDALGKRFGHTHMWAVKLLRASGDRPPEVHDKGARALAQLREELNAGTYAPGARMAFHQIGGHLGIGRGAVVAKVLDALTAEGLLEKRDGNHRERGYFVTGPLAPVIPLRPRRQAAPATVRTGLGRAA